LADAASRYQSAGDDKLCEVLEILAKNDPIMEHAVWMRGNLTDGYRSNLRASLPEVHLRALNEGVPHSKSTVYSVTSSTTQIVGSWSVDEDYLRLYEGDTLQAQIRKQEFEAFAQSMKHKAASLMLYGNRSADVKEVNGLSSLYPYKDAPNVVDAGGTSGDMTSIWGVVWGPRAFMGIYPKNMPMGLEYKDLGVVQADDANGNQYLAVRSQWSWNLGFHLSDYRMVVRICNIPVANLQKERGEEGFVDLVRLLIKAQAKIPAGYRSQLKWYASNQTMLALTLQQLDYPGRIVTPSQVYAESMPQNAMQCGVYEVDSILETESPLPAM